MTSSVQALTLASFLKSKTIYNIHTIFIKYKRYFSIWNVINRGFMEFRFFVWDLRNLDLIIEIESRDVRKAVDRDSGPPGQLQSRAPAILTKKLDHLLLLLLRL